MLYEPNEIRTSEKQLEKIFEQLEEPTCLLGGWAIYHTVNKNFEKANGRKYIGSRDIDIGFHIDKHWNEEQLTKSRAAFCALGFNAVCHFRGNCVEFMRKTKHHIFKHS
jgi:hypothetical protein